MKTVIGLLLTLAAFTVTAQNYPAPQEGTWVVRDFKFHTGEVLPELRPNNAKHEYYLTDAVALLRGLTPSDRRGVCSRRTGNRKQYWWTA